MIKTKLVNFNPYLSAFFPAHQTAWMLVGFQCSGDVFQRSSLLGFNRGVALSWLCLWRALCHVSSLHHDTRMCQSQRHPEQGRGAVTPAEGPKCCCSLFSPAPLQDPESSRMRRVGLPEEGSALLLWKAALPWGSSSCYSCHHPHICLSSQLGRMAFSGCHPGWLFPLAKADCYCKTPNEPRRAGLGPPALLTAFAIQWPECCLYTRLSSLRAHQLPYWFYARKEKRNPCKKWTSFCQSSLWGIPVLPDGAGQWEWGLEGHHGMSCMGNALQGCVSTLRCPLGAPLLLQHDTCMNHHSLYQFHYLWTFQGGWTKNLGTLRAAGIYQVPESMLFASSLAQPLLGEVKPKVPNQDPAFCWRVGNLPALRDPRNVGLGVRSAGWDTESSVVLLICWRICPYLWTNHLISLCLSFLVANDTPYLSPLISVEERVCLLVCILLQSFVRWLGPLYLDKINN